MLDDKRITQYLERISADRPHRPDLDALRHLQERHVLSVPWETLALRFGDEIPLDERILEKVVDRRRGGGCCEVNPALYFLLQSLGFEVTVHQGRVWIIDGFTPPFNHLVLKVRLDGVSWLVDVGFGKMSRYPLRLGSTEPQLDPHGEFSTRRVEPDATEVIRDGKLLYRFYDAPVELSDFVYTLWWYRTSPDASPRHHLLCSMPSENGWTTLKNDTLTLTTPEGTEVTELADDAEVIAALDKWFGVKIDELPEKGPYEQHPLRMSFETD